MNTSHQPTGFQKQNIQADYKQYLNLARLARALHLNHEPSPASDLGHHDLKNHLNQVMAIIQASLHQHGRFQGEKVRHYLH